MGEEYREVPTRASKASRFLWMTLLATAITTTLLLCLRFIAVPVAVLLKPELRDFFYDLAIYGAYPEQSYVSFDLTSPAARVVQSDPTCNDGLVFMGVGGLSVNHESPMIMDMQGNLVWMTDEFENAANVQVQSYQGRDFITFWSGEKLEESGRGSYYMLNSSYQVEHVVEAVGAGLAGDMHEFTITGGDTALITIYDPLSPAPASMCVDETCSAVDAIVQEIDIATGDLLFEWRASDHIDPSKGYLEKTSGGILSSGDLDYFHINSIDKDASGNYLVSIRHHHQIVYIDGRSGEILWTLGGGSQDFEDMSDGAASSFRWQHDARWVSSKEGVISVFDNGRARKNYDRSYSQGLLIQLDRDYMTATLLSSYQSSGFIGSASQGNVQHVEAGSDLESSNMFLGWGSSAAFSEHDIDGELLCETHFGAEMLFWWERVRSYRAFKIDTWMGLPTTWGPSARSRNGQVYVSWNGATEVDAWVLEARKASPAPDQHDEALEDRWYAVSHQRKGASFESVFDIDLPQAYANKYRVVALDSSGVLLRYSNATALAPRALNVAPWMAMPCLTIMLTAGLAISWKRRTRKLKLGKADDQYELGYAYQRIALEDGRDDSNPASRIH